ncbi:ExbD/TolR family protein [Croceitalea rosinachiae]|uniref:Biopolymer transporter ExbD n=1 Tax=Croceitalea rosinachiae TaxID=3075596 RepID=A0ABU3A700_9FLAO|nr:biopolymer transporter ExbD [Croceitalea sp. F388]MDT0605729.1 biopolymer transporter ExbD [Croceitalea sp. F388]
MAIKRETPEVNAGSMADIAFLLLIFFLVTTTLETDAGLSRKLPTTNDPSKIKERNLFRVNLNGSNQLLVEGQVLDIKDLREEAIAFLDNGRLYSGDGYCSYCKGNRDDLSSDNPQKAIISLSNTRETNYGHYITVQNELVGAYNALRNREAMRIYRVSYEDLMADYEDGKLSQEDKAVFKAKIEKIRELFPKNLSEAELNSK